MTNWCHWSVKGDVSYLKVCAQRQIVEWVPVLEAILGYNTDPLLGEVELLSAPSAHLGKYGPDSS